MIEFAHIPVMPEEAISSLSIREDGIYVDGTAGGGGHSALIAERLSDRGRLIALDQDEEAIEAASKKLEQYGDRVTIIRSNFRNIKQVVDDLGIREVNGIILDLGVSSHQLDDPDRGFSYMNDGPLDMRMDKRVSLDAQYIVNFYSQNELTHIIRDYGEDRYAARIADAIVRNREHGEIKTTAALAEIVREAVPGKAKYTGGHPAMRTFQALRIAVNGELDVLRDSIDTMIDLLSDGGRISVITFHSLEDRIVKEAFRRNENPCSCPPSFPVCVCGKKSKGRCIGKKPVTAGEKELIDNPRSHSAKLRTFERIR